MDIIPKGTVECRVSAVGDGLIAEAKEASLLATKLMTKYEWYMAKVNHTGEVVVKGTLEVDVNRWKHIKDEGKMMTSGNHDNWHTRFQGTARD